MKLLEIIAEEISSCTNKPFFLQDWKRVGGGSINSAFVISGNGQHYFVKTNHSSLISMFEAEATGLQELATTKTIRVPESICCGKSDDNAYLVLEYIEFGSKAATKKLGVQLANLHRVYESDFGWHRDNTIGSTPQSNTPNHDWCTFLAVNRFGLQIQLMQEKLAKNRIYASMEKLITDLPKFFTTYRPKPSLLHGDLWAGNYATDTQGEPVVFDPAVYFGDREVDIAMTELFGGFPSDFYHSYNDVFKLDEGYGVRKTLYNLYHILNHYNLFGGGYLSQAQAMTDRLLSELN